MTVKGIDVSNHQEYINWSVVPSDIKFAFIKASESIDFKDSWFDRNWIGAKQSGRYRGAYHYARPSRNEPVSEAHFFLDSIKYQELEPGDILVLDMEDPDFSGDVISWTLYFLQIVESIVGFNALLYSGNWYLDSRMPMPHRNVLQPYNLWLASYQETKPGPPLPWTGYEFWQYSDKGRVRGISRNVDLNEFSGELLDIPLYGKPAPGTSEIQKLLDRADTTIGNMNEEIAKLQAITADMRKILENK
jgi:lysozyme